MKQSCVAIATIFAATASYAETVTFDNDVPGSLPLAWQEGVTGRGAAKWAVAQDESAPSKPNVLRQNGVGAFPWAVRRGTSIENGFVEVRFKALAGREDQAGGHALAATPERPCRRPGCSQENRDQRGAVAQQHPADQQDGSEQKIPLQGQRHA